MQHSIEYYHIINYSISPPPPKEVKNHLSQNQIKDFGGPQLPDLKQDEQLLIVESLGKTGSKLVWKPNTVHPRGPQRSQKAMGAKTKLMILGVHSSQLKQDEQFMLAEPLGKTGPELVWKLNRVHLRDPQRSKKKHLPPMLN